MQIVVFGNLSLYPTITYITYQSKQQSSKLIVNRKFGCSCIVRLTDCSELDSYLYALELN